MGVSWWAHQRGNALSRVHVHVPCGRTDKRAMTNCQISLPTFTHASMFSQNTSCSHVRTQFSCYLMLSLRNPTECAVSQWISHEAHRIHISLVNLKWANNGTVEREREAVTQQPHHSREAQKCARISIFQDLLLFFH